MLNIPYKKTVFSIMIYDILKLKLMVIGITTCESRMSEKSTRKLGHSQVDSQSPKRSNRYHSHLTC
jgi:hypothetical protein